MENKKTTKKKSTKKKKKEIEGLGDVVENVLKKTGVAKAAKWVLGEDCGCDKRKDKLNKLFPRWKKAKCLQEKEYEWLKEWYSKPRGRMKSTEQAELIKIYNRVFNKKQRPTTCSSCLRDVNYRIQKVFEIYEQENK